MELVDSHRAQLVVGTAWLLEAEPMGMVVDLEQDGAGTL